MFRHLMAAVSALTNSLASTVGLLIALGFYAWVVSLLTEPDTEFGLWGTLLFVLGGLAFLSILFLLIGFANCQADEEDQS